MTTNVEHAEELIEDALDEPHLYPTGEMPAYAAQSLADAGLLMPDLPQPEEGEDDWNEGTIEISVCDFLRGHGVAFFDSEPGGVTMVSPEFAWNLGLKFMAAAKEAIEREKNA